MSTITNLTIFFVVLSILSVTLGQAYNLAGPTVLQALLSGNAAGNANSAAGLAQVGYNTSQAAAQANQADFYLEFLLIAAIGVGAVSGLGGSVGLNFFVFPNPFVVFSATAVAYTVLFMGMPIEIFNALPAPLNILFTITIGVVIAMGILDWYKNGPKA